MASREQAIPYAYEKLSVYGYLRDILSEQKDYDDIVLIIIFYHRQGFARYYDEVIDKDFKQKVRFGDVVKTKRGKYKVLDLNNKLKVIKTSGIYLDIPMSICQYLTDSMSYYSKLSEHGLQFTW